VRLIRQDMESYWLERAHAEKRRRTLASILGFVIAGLDVATGIVVVKAAPSLWPMTPFFIQPAAAGLALGVAPMVGPGPAESALRAYDRSTGRTIWKDDLPGLQPAMTPTLGGATLGLTGRF
jgi:hypothetical protein